MQGRSLWIGSAVLIVVGLLHRALQLWLLWPQLVTAIGLAPDNQLMQLLPKAIMSEHPWWGLWFLQQSPPLPNFIWAAVLGMTQSPIYMAIIFILLQALLSCATAAAMAVLFVRVGARWWLGLLLSSILFLSDDLLVLEYNTMGEFYYETMTMLLGLLACHAALSLIHKGSEKSALRLGLCVVGLALTRAVFSYFWSAVLLWLLCVGFWRKPKVIVMFLLPIFLLHGGWAYKNYHIYGYWSWSTSSWSGANIQHGERIRSGSNFNKWVAQQPAICASPWHELTAAEPQYPFFMPIPWSVTLPLAVTAQDQYIEDRRGAPAILDSVAARMWSQCLLKEFSRYWLAHPGLLINGAWRSYELFWQPIKQFHATQAFPLRADMDVYSGGVQWLRALRDSWREWSEGGYKIQQKPLQWGIAVQPLDFVPVQIIALPFFANFISAFNFALLHSIPLLLILAWYLRRPIDWPGGFSFLLLMYCYLVGLSSVVEYGENMRFRIEVEPIIWVVCFVVAKNWFSLGWAKKNNAVEN